ncbi:MAG TPA: ECF transporter S component [Ruminococcaceae bacterium]|nr:ECF transporter S component [Oscillospiraceae bacterium]
MTKTSKIKTLAAMAILAALAIAADLFLRIPGIGGFLTYEPKDVVLTIGAFIFGPVAGIIMSLVVCLVEMITVSSTGPVGLLMNFLSSGMFVGVASVIYYRKKTMSRAISGLIAAVLSMTAIMLLWNYIVTPLYMGVTREQVLAMFLPLLIPFNLIKASLNAALVLLLYKGVVTALRKSGLVPKREGSAGENKRTNTILVIVISAVAVTTLLLVMLIFAKII